MNIRKLLFLLIMLCLLSTACSNQSFLFKFEPTRRATALAELPLHDGDVLEINASNLKENETLILQRCGEPCNTAKLIKRWTREDFVEGESDSLTLVEDGLYYFWIQKVTEEGEVGPVFGKQEVADQSSTRLHYESGTVVEVSLQR